MSSDIADRRRKQALDEKRQAGQLPAEVDEVTGAMINPHNPDFITKRPWYLGESGPSLQHHSKQKNTAELTMKETDSLLHQKFADRRKKGGRAPATTGFRKGACKNCGAMGHKTMECVERPRSNNKAAWKTGLDIAQDDTKLELEDHGKVGFDGKRDRWAGYHPDQHKETIAKHAAMDEERRKARREKEAKEAEEARAAKTSAKRAGKGGGGKGGAKRGKNAGRSGEGDDGSSDDSSSGGSDMNSDSDSDSDDSDDDDSDDENEEFIMKEDEQKDFQGRHARQGGLGGAQMKTTVRNLRIREDRAKYLYNLNPDSAYYDPKTRSMRENPMPDANPEDLVYAGDNFIRFSGDTTGHAKTQLFAWEAQDRGQEIHPIADPSTAELLHKQFEAKKKDLKQNQSTRILDKYGGQEYLKAPDARLVMGQTEAYVEYDRTGRVVKGAEKAVAKSKYEEDVLRGNHTAIWGSYFDRSSMRWGYACCHSCTKSSYCTGDKGKEANDSANSALCIDDSQKRKMLEPQAAGEGRKAQEAPNPSKQLYGEGSLNVELDAKKLKKALKKQRKAALEEAQEPNKDDRKRSYNSMQTSDVSAEDMEAYRMSKRRENDPLASISSDTLVGEEEEEKEKK